MPHEEPFMQDADAPHGRMFKLRLLAARAVVSFERAYPTLWRPGLILALFLAAAWFDLFEALPSLLHAVLLVAFVAGFGWSIAPALRRFRPADADAGLARLERDSDLRHEALRALGDTRAGDQGDRVGQALWQAHRRRLQANLAKLRLAPPRSDLPRADPWALRALLLLVLVVALVDARGEYGARLAAAFVPWRPTPVTVLEPRAELWVSPPTYTRRPPLVAEQTAALDAFAAPAGSEVLAQVHHLPADEAGDVRLVQGGTETRFTDLGNGSAELRAGLESSGPLVIRTGKGRELALWTVEVVPDRPPTVAFAGEPKATHRAVLRVDLEAADDYGLKTIELLVAPQVRPSEVERFALAKPAGEPTALKTGSFLDLTAHPLAGLPVDLILEAADARDQRGRSAVLTMTLPEREFRHPLARAVIEQRKRFVAQPEARAEIGARLSILGSTPMAQSMGSGIPLSLHIAGVRTRDAEAPESRRPVIDLLWELALFIEDGSLSSAERELRALQERLQQALDENAEDAELEQLMRELQQALNRFLDELQRQAMEQAQQLTPEQREQMQRLDPSQMVDRNQLQEMLDRARELMRSGARDAARDMLAQLQQMLENLQAQMAMPPQQMGPQERALSDLQRMIQMQQNLLDRSFQMQRQQGQQQQGQQGQQQPGQQQPGQQQPGQQGQQQQGQQRQGQQPGQQGQRGQQGMQPGDSPGRASAEQEALRRALGELMRRMGEAGMEIPRALGQAEMQMRGARQSLEEGQPGQAAPSQSQALDLMQQSGQAMLEQLQQQMGQEMGPGPGGEPMQQGRRGRDPLGRAQYNDGGFDPRGEFVPDDADLGRARDVLEELYRRSGERSRPQQELDYYNRLLDRF